MTRTSCVLEDAYSDAMVDRPLIRRRLVAQGLVAPVATDPVVVARTFLASQAQDLAGVLSSLAMRLTPELGDGRMAMVLDAFDDGGIVRGYPMRGTVFAMAAEDSRWLTELCAGPDLRASRTRRPELGITEDGYERSRAIAREASDAPEGIARGDLFSLWNAAGIPTDGGRGYHMLKHQIMTGDVTYGPCDGTEHRIALADRWLPEGSDLETRFAGSEDDAAAELLRRYLTSRGPATLRDAGWFSKLGLGRLRAALPAVREHLEEAGVDARGEQRYQRAGLETELEAAGSTPDGTFLLPGFDEMVLGYPDRLDLMDAEHHEKLVPGNNGVFQRGVLRRGSMIGLWRRAGRPGRRSLEVTPFAPLPAVAEKEIRRRYAAFPVSAP